MDNVRGRGGMADEEKLQEVRPGTIPKDATWNKRTIIVHIHPQHSFIFPVYPINNHERVFSSSLG